MSSAANEESQWDCAVGQMLKLWSWSASTLLLFLLHDYDTSRWHLPVPMEYLLIGRPLCVRLAS